MKIILKENNKYILRFDKGEEVVQGLIDFCKTEEIEAGSFFGIGATQEIVISYYNLAEKKYYDTEIKEGMEIISLLGNVAKMPVSPAGGEEKIIIHVHGNFAGADLKPIAGHVKKLIVGPTCEIVLEKLEGRIEREYSEKIGLNLMK